MTLAREGSAAAKDVASAGLADLGRGGEAAREEAQLELWRRRVAKGRHRNDAAGHAHAIALAAAIAAGEELEAEASEHLDERIGQQGTAEGAPRTDAAAAEGATGHAERAPRSRGTSPIESRGTSPLGSRGTSPLSASRGTSPLPARPSGGADGAAITTERAHRASTESVGTADAHDDAVASDDRLRLMAEMGGIPPLVTLVATGSTMGKEQASCALWHLALDKTNQGLIVRANGASLHPPSSRSPSSRFPSSRWSILTAI